MPNDDEQLVQPQHQELKALSRAVSPTDYCSFCGKAPSEFTDSIAGPEVRICNECVEQCVIEFAARTREGDA